MSISQNNLFKHKAPRKKTSLQPNLSLRNAPNEKESAKIRLWTEAMKSTTRRDAPVDLSRTMTKGVVDPDPVPTEGWLAKGIGPLG